MDYARNNFIAQPGDLEKGVKLTPPVLGVYDIHAINWGYRLIGGAQTYNDEKATLDMWINEKAGDKMFEFGAQQYPATIDPTDQVEDLGNDHFAAGDLGISNLKIIMSNLEKWTHQPGARYDDVATLYNEVVTQYTRHVRHVMPYIGGVVYKEVRQGDGKPAKTYVDKKTQKKAISWLMNQARTYNDWITPYDLAGKMDINLNANDKILNSIIYSLFNSTALFRINEGASVDPKNNYQLNTYMDDVMAEILKVKNPARLTENEKLIISTSVNLLISNSGLVKAAAKTNTQALSDDYEEMISNTDKISVPCNCCHLDEQSFTRYTLTVPSLPKDKLAPVMIGKLKQTQQTLKARSAGASADTKNFYDYQLILIERAFDNK